MKIKTYTFEELIENPSFKNWVISNRVVDSKHWQEALNILENQAIIAEAEAFLNAFQFQEKVLPVADIDLAWEMLEAKISEPININRSVSRRVWLKIAAAAVLVSVISFTFLWTSKKSKSIAQATNFGEQSQLTLPDASTVKLNANTELVYNKKWETSKKREVSLKGQAFFDVESTKDKATFTVKTAHFDVEVLGTEFDVLSRKSGSSVTLKEGKVKVKFAEKSIIVTDNQESKATFVNLTPGQQLKFSEGKYIVSTVDIANATAWLNNELYLENPTLAELAKVLEDLYGYKVEFEDKALEAKTLNRIRLNTKNFDTILKMTEGGFGIKIEKEGNKLKVKN